MRKFIFQFLPLLFFYGASYAQNPIPYYNFPETDGSVYCIVADANYVYVGGAFDYVGYPFPNGAKVNATNAKLDFAYCKPNNQVNCVIPDGNGGWYIGGTFTAIAVDSVTAITRQRLAHILSNGQLDMGWAPVVNGPVYTLLLNGNELYVGGTFTIISGYNRLRLAKIITGAAVVVDPNWNPGVGGDVKDLELNGGYLYVAGNYNTIGGLSRSKISRVDPVGIGATDPVWNIGTNQTINSMAFTGTDIIVGGNFTTAGAYTRTKLAKLSTIGTGSVDANWTASANGNVNKVLVVNNDVYVGGNFAQMNNTTRHNIGRVTLNGIGTLDAAWNPDANFPVNDLLYDGSQLIACGMFETMDSLKHEGIVKLFTNGAGSVDTTWNPYVSGDAFCMALYMNTLYIGGNFPLIGGRYQKSMAKIDNNGILDTLWNPTPNHTISDMILSDTSLYVNGDLITIGGLPRTCIAKVSTNGVGATDPLWDPHPTGGGVTGIYKNGNDIYVGGLFSAIGGQNRNKIARIDAFGTGAADPVWNPDANDAVVSFLASGSDIILGGKFTTMGGAPHTRLAKVSLSGAGAADATWNPSASHTVECLLQEGNHLYVAGVFTMLNNVNTNRCGRIDINTGTLDAFWNPNVSSTVENAVLIPGYLFMTGQFTQAGGQYHDGIGMVKTTGTGVGNLNWNPSFGVTIMPGLWKQGNNIYAGGVFSTFVGAQPHTSLVKFDFTNVCISTIDTITHTMCQGANFLFNGQLLNAQGVYYDTLMNFDGCDSLITLLLTVNNPSANTITQTVCDSLTINGQTYTTDGVYTQLFNNAVGCDSILTINLTVKHSTASTVNQTACDILTFNGQNYTTTGTYMVHIVNAVGCDSAITLNATINTANAGITVSSPTITAAAVGAQYQWLSCNPYQAIAGETNQSFTANISGDYAVAVTENGCTDTSVCTSLIGVNTDDILFLSEIKLYPNPLSQILHIESDNELQNAVLKISSVTGQLLMKKNHISGKKIELNLSELVPGIYFAEILDSGRKYFYRILKE